jgi:parvulin-like peptidyl-prolyl isomerase
MKKIVKKYKDRREKKRQEKNPEVPSKVPNITNTTVAEHRDEVLGTARKYIYPLQHSKHRIILISTGIFIAVLIAFFSFCTLALYKWNTTAGFMYRVTQVVPFPVARINNQFVAYENYLFELRRYTHYYESQQKLDFENNELDQQQLEEFKRRALDRVVNYAYIKQIAKEKDITVSGQEVQDEIALWRTQDRFGSGERVLEDVLKDFYGWSKADFERYLEQELLTQKVVAALDPETTERAEAALQQLEEGKDFSKVAKKYSDDVTSKDNGGEFGFTITKNSRDLTPEATEALFSLKKGEFSGIVNTGYSLEIFKLLDKKNGKIQASHILFNFKDIEDTLNNKKEEQPARVYITLNEQTQE